MIANVSETLRVNGSAEILDAPALLDRFRKSGPRPKTVLRVTAEEIFLHCGKAPRRAGLWAPETWPDRRPVATLNEIIRDHSASPAERDDTERPHCKALD